MVDDIDLVCAFMRDRSLTREMLSEALPSKPTPESLRQILSKYRPPSDLLAYEIEDYFRPFSIGVTARGLRERVDYKRAPRRSRAA